MSHNTSFCIFSGIFRRNNYVPGFAAGRVRRPGLPVFSWPESRGENGAGGQDRTDDLLITNQLLCQLSYASVHVRHTARMAAVANRFYSAIALIFRELVAKSGCQKQQSGATNKPKDGKMTFSQDQFPMSRNRARRFVQLWLCVFVTATTFGKPAGSQTRSHSSDSGSESSGSHIDPKAEQLVRRASDLLSSASTIQVSIRTDTKLSTDRMSHESVTTATVAFARPNKLRIDVWRGGNESLVLFDGTTATLYESARKTYWQRNQPEELPMRRIAAMVGGAGPLPQPANYVPVILSKSPYRMMMGSAKSARNTGREKLGGSSVTRVHSVVGATDSDALYEDGDKVFLRKHIPNATVALRNNLVGSENLAGFKASCETAFDDWRINSPIAAERFAFVPPKDAMDGLAPLSSGLSPGTLSSSSSSAPPEPYSPLNALEEEPSERIKGKPAPDFELKDLDDKAVALSSLKGKVVVLDFWATWCGPCRMSLPIIASVSEKYKDRGVVFYAVNESETPVAVREFQEKQNLGFPVLFDTEGEIGNKYGADSIPRTVIIDKNGSVQAIHRGFSPQLEKELAQQLEDLLAGKTLEEPED